MRRTIQAAETGPCALGYQQRRSRLADPQRLCSTHATLGWFADVGRCQTLAVERAQLDRTGCRARSLSSVRLFASAVILVASDMGVCDTKSR